MKQEFTILLVDDNKEFIQMDMKLPPLNGLETYLKIREFCPLIVVVIITGFVHEMNETINIAREKGAYALLEKPINIDHLLAVLDKINCRIDNENPDTLILN